MKGRRSIIEHIRDMLRGGAGRRGRFVPLAGVACLVCMSVACTDTEDAVIAVDVERLWSEYAPQAPSPELETILSGTAAKYPDTLCVPVTDEMVGIDSSNIQVADDGREEICIWQHPAGCVPEGNAYADVVTCDNVRTLGPSWFIPPTRQYEGDASRLDDATYRTELEWYEGRLRLAHAHVATRRRYQVTPVTSISMHPVCGQTP